MEPITGLSPLLQAAVWERIAAVRETGVAVAVVGQNTHGTLAHADWAYVMASDEIAWRGPGRTCSRTRP